MPLAWSVTFAEGPGVGINLYFLPGYISGKLLILPDTQMGWEFTTGQFKCPHLTFQRLGLSCRQKLQKYNLLVADYCRQLAWQPKLLNIWFVTLVLTGLNICGAQSVTATTCTSSNLIS